MILWFAGDFLWFIYDMFLNKQPFSGLPDWIILVGYAGLFMSVIVQLRNIRLNLEFKKVYPYYLLTGILIIFSIYYFITLLYQSNNGINFNLINVLHIIANASLFFVMFLVAMLVKHFKGGKVSHFWLIIMLAVLANLLGYSFYNIFESQYNLGGNYIFAMIDLLWILSNLLFTYGLYYFSGFLNQLKLSFKNEIK